MSPFAPIMTAISAPFLSQCPISPNLKNSRSWFSIRPVHCVGKLSGRSMCGNTQDGLSYGFSGILASVGHMRWLRGNSETPPYEKPHCSGQLKDCADASPCLSIRSSMDLHGGAVDNAPLLERRQCLREEKAPLAPYRFYQASKLTDKWHKAIVVE